MSVETLQNQLDTALRRAESLRRFIELISGELALEPLLTRLIECATDLIGAQYGSIGLVKQRADGPVVQIAAIVNMPPLELGSEIPIGVGLAGQVLRDQQAVCMERYRDLDTPRISTLAEHSVIGIPIWQNRRMIGFFGIGAEPPRCFDAQDVETLMVFARHAAIAIENAHRFEYEQQRNERLTLIAHIGQLITSSPGSDSVFQTAITAIAHHFDFSFVAAALINPEDPQVFIPFADTRAAGTDLPASYLWSIQAGPASVAARTRQRVMVGGSAHDSPTAAPEHTLPGSELNVPIIVGDRILGMITVQSQRSIDEEEARSIEIITDQFGVALEHARLFGSMQYALETMQFLYATSQRISTAMSVEEVIAAYLGQVATHGRQACSIVLFETDYLARRTTMILRGRWTPQGGTQLGETRWPFLEAPFTPLLDAGQAVTFADVHTEPDIPDVLRDIQIQYEQVALALVPLIVRGTRIGIVLLSYPHPYEWLDTDLQPYQATAAQLAAAIDSRQQHLLLSERGQQLAVLEERRRLARELHDSVTQSLFSMSLLAQVVPDLWEIDREEARQALGNIRDLTRGALAEMRALLFELRPADAGEQNLAQLLQRHANDFERRTESTVVVKADADITLPGEVVQALSRIAQEALNNINRHARAHQVQISLQGRQPTRMRIIDDGIGFHPDQIGETSFGLISIRERSDRINARCAIHSAPGQGTEILIEWPDPTPERV